MVFLWLIVNFSQFEHICIKAPTSLSQPLSVIGAGDIQSYLKTGLSIHINKDFGGTYAMEIDKENAAIMHNPNECQAGIGRENFTTFVT